MRAMFSTVAPRYDFITRAFSYGMDSAGNGTAWSAPLPERADGARSRRRHRRFLLMVRSAIPGARRSRWISPSACCSSPGSAACNDTVCGDAGLLPFPDDSFDCVFVGYGLRNFPNLKVAVREIERVTRPGGVLVSLDFFLPVESGDAQLYLGYLYAQGAFWGTVLHGRPRVYTYIPDSLRSFVSIDDFSSLLRRTGYRQSGRAEYILGGIGLHWAEK